MSLFAERLKEAVTQRCKERSTNVNKMANDLEIDRVRFRHYWERGSRPDHDLLLKISDYLCIDLNWLLGRDVSMEWPKHDQFEEIIAELRELRELRSKD